MKIIKNPASAQDPRAHVIGLGGWQRTCVKTCARRSVLQQRWALNADLGNPTQVARQEMARGGA